MMLIQKQQELQKNRAFAEENQINFRYLNPSHNYDTNYDNDCP